MSSSRMATAEPRSFLGSLLLAAFQPQKQRELQGSGHAARRYLASLAMNVIKTEIMIETGASGMGIDD